MGIKIESEKPKSIKVNAAYNIVKTCSSILFPLITYKYASNILLPKGMGRIDFSNSIINYFSLIASLGIATYAIRECSIVRDDKKKLSDVSSEIFSINIITTLLAYVLLAIALILFRKLQEYRLLITILSSSILFTTIGVDWLNSAMEDYKYITQRTVLFQVLAMIFVVVFVKNEDDCILYSLITVLSVGAANIANMFYRRKFCRVRFTKCINWKKHIPPILALFAMLLSQIIFNSVDITMIGWMKGDHEVGLYTNAVKVSQLVNQLVAAILWVVLPRLTILFEKKNYEQINSLLTKLFGLSVMISFPSAIGIFMLSDDVIRLISSEEYLGGTIALKILMISFVFSSIGGSFWGNLVLLPSKREKMYMIICCVAAAFNVVSNAILIPRGGIIAAGCTTVVSSMIIMILTFVVRDRNIHLEGVPHLIVTPLVGSGVIVVICYLSIKLIASSLARLIFAVLLSVIVYFAIQLLGRNPLIISALDSIKSVHNKKN